jgi:uncharacterized membrane protein YdbT with pleckstrin-like domain
MNPQDLPQDPNHSRLPPVYNPLEVMQPGEQTICEIKRHPIGMLGVYLISGTLLLVLAILAFVVAPGVFSDNRSQVMALGGLAFLVIGGLLLGFVFIANKVYWGNSWVVTSDSLTQITQTSLFSKQSSQLSLGNLEDVTVEQDGIFPQLFKYGLLRVETAGERSKFVFPFCPNPNYYAQKVLAAREAFEQRRHAAEQNSQPGLYREEGAYPAPQPQPQPPVYPPNPLNPPNQ